MSSVPCRRRRDSGTNFDGGPAGGRGGRRAGVVGQPRRRLPPFTAARAGDERAQRRRLEHHLQLAVPGGRIERHDHGVDLRQRQRQDHEVGDVAEHQPDPRARARCPARAAPARAGRPGGAARATRGRCRDRPALCHCSGSRRRSKAIRKAACCGRRPFREAPASLYADGRPPQGPLPSATQVRPTGQAAQPASSTATLAGLAGGDEVASPARSLFSARYSVTMCRPT